MHKCHRAHHPNLVLSQVGYSIVNLYADGNDWTEYHRDPGSGTETFTQATSSLDSAASWVFREGRAVMMD